MINKIKSESCQVKVIDLAVKLLNEFCAFIDNSQIIQNLDLKLKTA